MTGQNASSAVMAQRVEAHDSLGGQGAAIDGFVNKAYLDEESLRGGTATHAPIPKG